MPLYNRAQLAAAHLLAAAAVALDEQRHVDVDDLVVQPGEGLHAGHVLAVDLDVGALVQHQDLLGPACDAGGGADCCHAQVQQQPAGQWAQVPIAAGALAAAAASSASP